MKLVDAVKNVIIPTDPNILRWQCDANYEAINESLEIHNMWSGWPDEIDARIREYPIYQWLCTDTWVGLKAIYFDGKPAGATFQNARKNHVDVKWLSLEIALEVRAAIMATFDPKIDLIDPEEDIGDDFVVSYVGQALSADGFYEGRPVRALIWYETYGGHCTTPKENRKPDRPYYVSVKHGDPKSEHVLVRDGDEERLIHIDDFKMKFNVRLPAD